MRFTLLGSGTSTGVPLPGCRCRVCSSNDPKNFRNRTSGILELDDGYAILIDATTDLRHQAIKWGVSRVDAVLYTHAHADHILGTDDLRSFNFLHKNRIPCYGTHSTLDGLKRSFGYIFDPDRSYKGGLLAQLDLHEISNDEPVMIGTQQIEPFALAHGGTSVTGFRVGDLGYATDFKVISERGEKILRGVKHLFIDGLRYEQHNTHLTIPEAIELAQRLEAEKSYLIHTTHTVDYNEVNPTLPPGIELGYDGLQVEVTV